MDRPAAYSVVQTTAARAHESAIHLREACLTTPDIAHVLDTVAIHQIFEEKLAIQNAGVLVDRLANIG